MGRILAGVLFLAACADNGVEQPTTVNPPRGVDTIQPTGEGLPTAHFVPTACGELSWTISGGNNAIDVAVLPRSFGVQVLAVPLAGGAMSAYTLDKGMEMQTLQPALTIDDTFTSVSASVVRGRLTATGIDASSISVDVVADDLSRAQLVAKLQPGMIAKPAFQVSDGISFIPVADSQGLRIEQFDGAWDGTTTRVATTEPATGMTATAMGDATVAAWSTASSCYMMTLYTTAPGPLVHIPEACNSPHLAIDPASEKGVLVFEGTDGIRVIETEHAGVVGVSKLLRLYGTSPRALWDGKRVWISHLDQRGDMIIGYLENGKYVSSAISGPHPASSAYDLVMIDGSVWTVSFDADTYQADRLCILPTING
jgi:hypothetical protein